jgi:hypothetical protein
VVKPQSPGPPQDGLIPLSFNNSGGELMPVNFSRRSNAGPADWPINFTRGEANSLHYLQLFTVALRRFGSIFRAGGRK